MEPVEPTDSAAAAAIFVGIDVSKATLDVALRPSGEHWGSPNDEAGSTDLVDRLRPRGPQWMVLEATGGLERLVVAALALAGLPVAVVHPRPVRDVAKATGRLAKTDAWDAAGLAHFAAAIHPAPRPLPDAQSQALTALVERRQQVVSMLTAEKNRLRQAGPAVHATVAAHIAWLEQALQELDKELEQALQELDKELDQTLRASPLWRERVQLLRRVPGVGPTVSLPLLAHLPALGHGSVKHVASTWPPWWASRRSLEIAGPGAARGPSGAGGGRSARRSTWPLWSVCATIRCSPSSTSACSPAANPRRSP